MMTKQNIKRWLISTLITFAGGFSIALLANIDSISLTTLRDGTLAGLLFICFRQGFKAVLELFVYFYSNWKK